MQDTKIDNRNRKERKTRRAKIRGSCRKEMKGGYQEVEKEERKGERLKLLCDNIIRGIEEKYKK